MFDYFSRLFSADFMPHGHCYLWQPQILWTHVMADGFIALAYYSIPLALIYLVRKRRDVAFEWIFVMFGVFICACGTTHVMEIITVWNPMYRLAGLIKVITAIASVTTAAVLWQLMPRIIALPSPRQLRAANERLELEITARRQAEAALVQARDDMERRVVERTAELARVNEELTSSQRQFQAILDHSPAVIFLKDREGRFLMVNRAFETLFGRTGEELRGKTALDLVPRAEGEEHQGHDRQVFATGLPMETEETVPQPDGPHTFLSIKFLLPSPDGSADKLCGIAHDVTARKRTEAELQQAKEEAERANNAKSEFLSRMSHELRTPLNAILGFGQILEMDGPNEDQRQSVDQILKGGRHLLALINEVLDIARVDAGRMALSLEPVHASALISEALDLLRPLAAERNVTLSPHPVDGAIAGPAWVLADRQRLKQILVNLLSNAVKYNREGGEVSVWCEPGPGAPSRLRLAVRDTGSGIALADQSRMFEPFERLRADRDGIEGSGLGLTLVKRLTEAMDGRLLLESVPGQGSVFFVELPRVQGEHLEAATPGAAPTAAESGTARSSGRTILYIEDNLSNLNLIELLLARRLGVRLIPAMQGRLGLELAHEHQPDLILLDLNLPDIHGSEVLRRLRLDPNTRNVPVLVISADATPQQTAALLAAGACGYLTKPLEIAEFLRTLDDQLAVTLK